jgi:hypothetical protein
MKDSDDNDLFEYRGYEIAVTLNSGGFKWHVFSGLAEIAESASFFMTEHDARRDAQSYIDRIIPAKSDEKQGDDPSEYISSIAISRADLMADIFTGILTRINKHGLDVDHIAVANLATVVYESMELEEE